jgi:transcriptional regulator with XRE-family HTH domain
MDAAMAIVLPDKELIGSRIRETRERAGLEQKDLGQLLGLSQANISKFERGMALTLENIFALAEALDCSIFWLLGIGVEQLNPKEKEIRLLELFQSLPDHQDAVLSILEGMAVKYGNRNGK